MNTQVKRKIHYIDAAVQNRLLIAFVSLEVLLIGAGMIVLYLDLRQVIDDNLFRIHFAARVPLSTLLFREAMQAVAVLIGTNVAALFLARWLWLRYLDSILCPLSGLLARTGELDFTRDETFSQQHAVLVLAATWRETERKRCTDIRAEISSLGKPGDDSSPPSIEQTRTILESLKKRLPSSMDAP